MKNSKLATWTALVALIILTAFARYAPVGRRRFIARAALNPITVESASLSGYYSPETKRAALFVRPPTPLPTNGARWYVAPSGTHVGQGTLASPWDLATALAGGRTRTEVQPGAIIWVRGGTYLGAFNTALAGTPAAPILVRNYHGERAILDQNGASGPALNFPSDSANVWIWGLEFTNSEPTRTTTVAGPAPPINRGLVSDLVSVTGRNVKLINCVMHDGGNGIGMWMEARNSEIYGCLSFNNGWHGPDLGWGHGIYTQNASPDTNPSQRIVRETLIWNNFGFGLHAYGQDTEQIQNLLCEGLVSFNNGAPNAAYTGTATRYDNLLAAASQPCKLITVRNCYLYHPPKVDAVGLEAGYRGVSNLDLTLRDNYIAGGSAALYCRDWQSATVVGNTLIARAPTSASEWTPGLCTVNTFSGTRPAGYTWKSNTYYDATNPTGGAPRPFRCDGVTEGSNTLLTYNGWKAGTGYDASSSYTLGLPGSNRVFVRPNAYEAGRAHIIVYNWQGLSAVRVNLSGTGLVDGQAYEIRNVQDYIGMPVVTGTYSSAHPTVSLPMTDPAVTSPIGFEAHPIASTLPEFGAFVLLPIAGQ